MPCFLPARDAFILQSWQDPKLVHQSRLTSHSQITNTRAEDIRSLATSHIKQQNQPTELGFELSLNLKPPPSQLLSRGRADDSHTSPLKKAPEYTGVGSRSKKGRTTVTSMPKRSAEKFPEPPSRRQRPNQPQIPFKDESYIRSTMHVPSPQEYPELPPELFVNPKPVLHNVIQGAGHILSEYAPMTGKSRGAFRCTLTCEFYGVLESITVVGEGINKVTPYVYASL